MLKKVRVDQIRIGMHVHEFCGSWMSHPFWRSKFSLREESDLLRIRNSGIAELWIDTRKGLDLEGELDSEAVDEHVELQLATVASVGSKALAQPSTRNAIEEAAALYRKSIPQVKSMFAEARMGRAINVQECLPLVEDLTQSVLRNPHALINVARLKNKDDYTYMHSVAVSALMVALGRQLGLQGDELTTVGLAGMLHDLGKAVMPLHVLNKPGRLTEEEFVLMRAHPERGHEMLVEGGAVEGVVLDVCLYHHEKVDGSGYPRGLRGEQLSLFAKMGAVCDVYDAVTSVRPYKEAWDPGEALRRMAQWKGHFDATVLQCFVKAVGIYPVGSLVRLHSGKLAVVVAQNPDSLLTPVVKTFFSIKSNLRIEPQEVNLAGRLCQDKIVGCEPPEKWSFGDLNHLCAA